MFKVKNKDTRTISPCSGVSIINFEQVNAIWDIKTTHFNDLALQNIYFLTKQMF